MEVTIKEDVTWNTEKGAQQTEAAAEWLREQYNRLAMNPSETDKVIPTIDKWGRPVEWLITGDGWRLTVHREYVSEKEPTWARRRDVVTVDAVAQEGGNV